MSDWSQHLGHTRRLFENLAWLAAAALVTLMLATSAALAMWLDRRAGQGATETIMIDLPPMPVAEAVTEDPGPQPESSADAPDAPDAPDLDDAPPQTETAVDDVPEFEQPDLPEPEDVAEDLPDTTPPEPLPEPEPEPEPVKKAEVELPKPVQKKAPPKQERPAKKDTEQKEAQGRKTEASTAAKAGGASASGNNASASEMKRWQARAQKIVHGKVRTGGSGKGGSVVLTIRVAASGAVSDVSIRGTTGSPEKDAQLVSRARGAKLPPPPSGKAEVLSLTVKDR